MTRLCEKCGDPIFEVFAAATGEPICCDCYEGDVDPLHCVQQDAFVQGWYAAIEQRDKEDREAGVTDDALDDFMLTYPGGEP
ncbi:MAG: hypothetical protein AMJ84_00030 [Acidithiobacillales bacterium SM23_46]|nr:MAG: hypothetical protein AMJ84_00030 [Acidithiobacillales bacterium SM23_46]KPL28993.1 MAG: hypothetical protein AMJ72_00085 [Acidithiobacillales bacterium SM1_46]